jgi:ribA/ribD-fused uncharacterized protein
VKIDKFTGDYRFLSNFFLSPICMNGLVYPTVEHAYQAMKTFDQEERVRIAGQPTPGKAKSAGRKVTLRSDWENVKIDIMENLLRLKFKWPHLRDKLLATGDTELIEGNSWGDRFWGVFLGRGRNELGLALMRIRKELVDARD